MSLDWRILLIGFLLIDLFLTALFIILYTINIKKVQKTKKEIDTLAASVKKIQDKLKF